MDSSSSLTPSPSTIFDISDLNYGLLSLLLPRIKSMCKYKSITIPFLPTSSSSISQISYTRANEQIIMTLLHSLLTLCTLGWTYRKCNNDSYILHDRMSENRNNPLTDSITPGMDIMKVSLQEHLSDAVGNKLLHPFLVEEQRRRKLRKFILITAICPILYQLLQYYMLYYDELYNDIMRSNQDDSSTSDSPVIDNQQGNMRKLAIMRRRKVVRYILKVISFIIPPLQLYIHLSYLRHRGRYNTSPTLAHTLSNLTYGHNITTHGNNQSQAENSTEEGSRGMEDKSQSSMTISNIERSINFDYAYRRLLYEEMILLISSIFPLEIMSSLPISLVNKLNQLKNRFSTNIKSFIHHHRLKSKRCSVQMNQNNINHQLEKHPCPICFSKPISIPYITSCGHIYCYTCLRNMVVDNIQHRCNICGTKIQSSKRVDLQSYSSIT